MPDPVLDTKEIKVNKTQRNMSRGGERDTGKHAVVIIINEYCTIEGEQSTVGTR